MTVQRRFDVVTFDFWDTLIVADGPATRAARRTTMLGLLAEMGHQVTPHEIDAAFDATVAVYNQHWADNRQFTADEAAHHVADLLGRDLSAADRERLADAFAAASEAVPHELTPNVAPTLERLRTCGVRLAIICDVGLTPSPVLRRYLAGHDVLDRFDHWSFSDEVGVYKPSPEIFAHALDGLGGVDPARAAHVGDLRRTDVAGARAFGMTSVRYAGSNDDAPGDDEHPDGYAEADHVIDDHADLFDVLGLV